MKRCADGNKVVRKKDISEFFESLPSKKKRME